MAILPSGDIPENPWRQNSTSDRRSRTVVPPLPVTEELYESLSRPVPTPSNDWFTILRNVFLAVGSLAVVAALAVVSIFSSRPTEPGTSPIDTKRASQQHPRNTAGLAREQSSVSPSVPSLVVPLPSPQQPVSSNSGYIHNSPPQVTSSPRANASMSQGLSSSSAAAHPVPSATTHVLPAAAPSYVPGTPIARTTPPSTTPSYVPGTPVARTTPPSTTPSYVPGTPVARTASPSATSWQVSAQPPVLRRSSPNVPLLPDPDYR